MLLIVFYPLLESGIGHFLLKNKMYLDVIQLTCMRYTACHAQWCMLLGMQRVQKARMLRAVVGLQHKLNSTMAYFNQHCPESTKQRA